MRLIRRTGHADLHGMQGESREERWRARPVLSRLLQAAIVLTPIGVSMAVSWTVLHFVHPTGHRDLFLAALAVVALGVGLAVERVLRRFTPLAMLLRLTMLFPDKAPSRLKMARSAGTSRGLIQRLKQQDQDGAVTTAEKVLTLITALGNHDRRTRGHSERVRLFADMLAAGMHLPDRARDRLRWAALLHDVGKLEIAPEILNKPSRLDRDEFARIQQHPALGADLATPLLPWLGEWGLGILHHHERWDGQGYPTGLSAGGISLAGRMLCVVDSFETMTAARPYKKPMATKAAREELTRCAGAQFDPECVRAFLAISLPRLFLAMGPLSFLAQLPFLRSIAAAGSKATVAAPQAAAAAATGMASVATAGALGVAVGATAVGHQPAQHALNVDTGIRHSVPAAAPPTPATAKPGRSGKAPTQPSAPSPGGSAPTRQADPTPPASAPAAAAPSQPRDATATAGDGQVVVSWQPPAADGGAPVSGYTVTAYDGTTALPSVSAGPSATSVTVTGLSDGTPYTFHVLATNSAGDSPPATAGPVTPAAPVPPVAAPDRPQAVQAGAGDRTATVTWQPPAGDGGAPVTSYVVTASSGARTLPPLTVAAPATSATFTGLVDGQAYTFSVTAHNSAGDSAPATSGPVTPLGPPDRPQSVSATAADGRAMVSWQPPDSDGGSPVTAYAVTAYDGTTVASIQQVGGDGDTVTITGLTDGQGYTFRVIAVNAIGTSPPATSGVVTPSTTPGPPEAVTVTAGDGQANVQWQPPDTDGGSPVTGYTVTPYDGTNALTPVTVSAPASSATVSGLSDGTAYTFTVVATNANGDSPAATSPPATPVGAPSRPRSVSAAPGDGQATVSWQAPADDGGSPVSGYTVTAYDGSTALGVQQVAADQSSATVTGLTNGQPYTFQVTAANSAGQSDPGVSPPVTPSRVPDAPGSVSAEPGDGSAVVSWRAPAGDGGSALTGYTVTPYDGSTALPSVTVGASRRQAAITGLTNGTAYTFSVVASNADGDSPAATTAAVTPSAGYTPPGSPQSVSATPGDGQAVVSWQPPVSDGGTVVTSYTVTPYDGSTALTPVTVDGSTTSATVSGLSDGTAYTFSVVATNASGDSPAATSAPVTPAGPPGRPQSASATAGDGQAVVSWQPPASDGGSPVTGYTITPYQGNTALPAVQAGASATSATVTGLTDGTAYTFSIVATNAQGDSAAATTAPVTPIGADTPVNVQAAADNASATVWWDPPPDAGSVTRYVVTAWHAGTSVTSTSVSAPQTVAIVTGLTNGVDYVFTVSTVTSSAASSGTAGTSAPSNSVTPLPGAGIGRPAPPNHVTASGQSGAIAVDWQEPPGPSNGPVTSYLITLYDGLGLEVGTALAPPDGTSVTVVGVSPGNYRVTVTATNVRGSSGESPMSALVRVS